MNKTVANQNYLDLLKETLTASVYPESSWIIIRPRRGSGIFGPVKNFIINRLAHSNIALVKRIPYDPIRREEGKDWPLFGYSMIGHKRLENIEACIRSIVADGIDGDFVECGVWRGGASIFARAVLLQLGEGHRGVWLADSFEGMPI